jgi:hypothetical protein
MNMGMTLGVFAAFCRKTGRPFLFPGNATQWKCITDMSRSRQLGFLEYKTSDQAFFDLFARLRREQVIPHIER